jgi:hypothetical protein
MATRSVANDQTGLSQELSDLARVLRTILDPYHPEQHYMRGPGPKWHAKHDRSVADDVGPGLAHVEL